MNTDNGFKMMLEKQVPFYMNDYDYDYDYELKTKDKTPLYATREEVINKFNELKTVLCNQELSDSAKKDAISKIGFDEFEKVLASNEY